MHHAIVEPSATKTTGIRSRAVALVVATAKTDADATVFVIPACGSAYGNYIRTSKLVALCRGQQANGLGYRLGGACQL